MGWLRLARAEGRWQRGGVGTKRLERCYSRLIGSREMIFAGAQFQEESAMSGNLENQAGALPGLTCRPRAVTETATKKSLGGCVHGWIHRSGRPSVSESEAIHLCARSAPTSSWLR